MHSDLQHPPHPKRSPNVAALLSVLERHSVRYVLTGSVAVLAYGIDIGTAGDLDITPSLDTENLRRLAAVLHQIEAGLDLDAPFGHWDTGADGERHWVVDAPTPSLRLARATWQPDPADVNSFDSLFTSRHGNFDIVPELSGAYDTLMQRAVSLQTWGYTIWVAHVDDLLAALTIPRRQKDAPRVRALRQIQRAQGPRNP